MATFQTGFQSADDTLVATAFLGKLKYRAEHHEGIEVGVASHGAVGQDERRQPPLARVAPRRHPPPARDALHTNLFF